MPGYRHHALIHDTSDDLLRAAVPFLRAGLAGGDTAVLVCRPERNAQIGEALGPDAGVAVLPQGDIYLRHAYAVATYRAMMRRHLDTGTGRVRLVGEVDFGAGPDTWDEWIRFESVVNAVLAPYPLSSVCVYDTAVLPEAVVASAEQTHPMLLTPTGPRRNPRYVPPEAFLRAEPERDPLEAGAPTVEFGVLGTLGEITGLRRRMRATPALTGLPTGRTDLVAAVAEVAANGLVHGRRPVRVRMWVASTRILCTVTDQGPGFDGGLAGYAPVDTDDPQRTGAGLWLARQNCDRLETARTPEGFVVRLSLDVPGSAVRAPHAAEARAETAHRRAEKAHRRVRELERAVARLDARMAARRHRRRRPPPAPGPIGRR
ncbi:anti-sigma factor RsbA family regulatory protein [Pseudonocardia sp. RS010]|uniref:anti-sigma factor RsbA family regulatory protein n=1 Tax=Pseudonocardia sp. RS010 TaxID=3385979 RepID=UPI0039A0C1DC